MSCLSFLCHAEKTPNVFTDKLQDGSSGPEMVIIPAGKFMMGSPLSEKGRYRDESPQHLVNIGKPFSLGLKEVTVSEFAKFIQSTNYETEAEKQQSSQRKESELGIWVYDDINWQHDHKGDISKPNFPAVHVSWYDAKEYVKWLSNQTGYNYRLPSEAEFEYANRANTNTRYWWGNDPPQQLVGNIKGQGDQNLTPDYLWQTTEDEHRHANYDGNTLFSFTNYGDGFGGLAPVGSFSTNNFGLHDTAGNVWEWVEDCWHPNYVNAPTDRSAWIDEENVDCDVRIARGGSWYCYPRHVRSANRFPVVISNRGMYVGFRVAREI